LAVAKLAGDQAIFPHKRMQITMAVARGNCWMDRLHEIIAVIGKERFETACAEAMKAATGTGTSLGKDDFKSDDIPHSISDMIWDEPGDTLAKLQLAFRFYEAMPCFGYLMYLSMNYPQFSSENKDYFWSQYKHYLSGDNTLADPVAYSLWCNFFEDAGMVQEAWDNLTRDISNGVLLRRVLLSSGPVPFPLKAKLYQRLLPQKIWHPAIFRSLLHSQFDVYGSMDRKSGLAILKQLKLPKDTENLSLLKDALQKKNN